MLYIFHFHYPHILKCIDYSLKHSLFHIFYQFYFCNYLYHKINISHHITKKQGWKSTLFQIIIYNFLLFTKHISFSKFFLLNYTYHSKINHYFFFVCKGNKMLLCFCWHWWFFLEFFLTKKAAQYKWSFIFFVIHFFIHNMSFFDLWYICWILKCMNP